MKKQSKQSRSVTPTHSDIVFLQGKKVTLRPLLEEDIPFLLKWINTEEVRRYLMRYTPATRKIEHDWLEYLHKNQDKDVCLVIQAGRRPIGTIHVRIDWKDRVGNIGIQIGEPVNQEKGYGTDAAMTILKYSFDTLNLRKLEWLANAINDRSIACAKRCGFKEEARLREELFVDGKYCDQLIFGLFRHEWLPRWQTYQKK